VHGFPASMLTHNGAMFTAASRHSRSAMELEAAALGIAYRHSRPSSVATDLLPEAWIAPPEAREARRVVRLRTSLVRIRSRLKCQVHALVAEHGVTSYRERRPPLP